MNDLNTMSIGQQSIILVGLVVANNKKKCFFNNFQYFRAFLSFIMSQHENLSTTNKKNSINKAGIQLEFGKLFAYLPATTV